MWDVNSPVWDVTVNCSHQVTSKANVASICNVEF